MAGNPREQRSPTPDIAFLQERGGLSVQHWGELIKRLDYPKNTTRDKIIAYGRKVIDGEFQSVDNHHRAYLGRRHWEFVAHNVHTLDTVVDGRTYGIFPRNKYVLNETARQIQAYARSESPLSYTLDDFMYYTDDKRSDVFEWHGDRWMSYYWEEDFEGGQFFKVRKKYSQPSDDDILHHWLLSSNEIASPQRTPKRDITRTLIDVAKANPQLIRERLKRRLENATTLHNSPHFGILEREVP